MKELRDIKQEFDAGKNTPLTFEQLTPGRRKPVIWTCAKRGHSWPATVSNRLKGAECPYCKGKLPILGETDLASKFPDLAAEWDYSRNKSHPEEFLPFSNTRVAWVCGAGHHWEEKINNRTSKGLGCPYCGGSRPIPGFNDLETLYPWIAEQWDHEKNSDLNPSHVFPQSNRRVGWICSKGHRWETKIYHRTDGQNCPYCAGLKPIVGETDLETLESGIAKQWHPEKNNGHLPSEYTRSSHYEAWWQCELGHEYRMPIYRRSRGCGCSICDGKTIVAGVNDLATLAPHLALEWDHSRNKDIRPDQVALHSNTKYHWICSQCGHAWKASPNNRATGRGCPKCAGFCVDPEINSIAAVDPLLAEQWDFDHNAPLTPRDVSAYDNRDYFWTCSNGHSWQASPANRRKGTACPYCKGKLPVVGINDFGTICPAVAAQWHPSKNGDSLPQHFLPNSHENVWWKCEDGHEWKASIESRTRGARCPICCNRQVRHRYLI